MRRVISDAFVEVMNLRWFMRVGTNRPLAVGAIAVWALLMGLAFSPSIFSTPDNPGDYVTRRTADVAMVCWAIAAGSLLMSRRPFGRLMWSLGCLSFLIHVAIAFDRVHGWTHQAAFAHVEDVSGWGPGVYISYGFTLLWLADTVWWWTDLAAYERRPVWLDRTVHGFFVFVVFNGTVVYETGYIRWASILAFAVLLLLAVRYWGRT